MCPPYHFQSAPCLGRRAVGALKIPFRLISIHAPCAGATKLKIKIKLTIDFNPPPCAGATSGVQISPPPQRGFQSTPPARGRPVGRCSAGQSLYFNPRPCAGGDFDFVGQKTVFRFQSRPPARGRLDTTVPVCRVGCYFNPRPLRGGDNLLSECNIFVNIVSIHAPCAGATQQKRVAARNNRPNFNPAPCAGAT